MKPQRIESRGSPAIKEAIRIREKRSKYGQKAFLIEGPHLIGAAPAISIKKVFFTVKFRGHNPGMINGLLKGGVPAFEVTEAIIGVLSDTETPQGIIAVASYIPPEKLDTSGVLVVCDEMREPGNMGAIIRTADAAGAGGVIVLPGTCDPFEGKALRASAGSVFNVPLYYRERNALIKELKDKKVKLVATALDAGLSIFDADLSGPSAFVFGNESRGVSDGIKEAADFLVKIPLKGKAESLNVAASAAVCLYEAMRQGMRKKP